MPAAGSEPSVPDPLGSATAEVPMILDPDDPRLASTYDIDPDRPAVSACMITSLDGRATGADGRSGTLSDPIDRAVLSLVRARSDAIIVGAATVRQERYRLPVTPAGELAAQRAARGQSASPVLVIVTRTGDLPLDLDCLVAPTVVVTGTKATDAAIQRLREVVEVVVMPTAEVLPADLVTLLRQRGLRHLSVEGGPELLSQFVADSAIDHCLLTLATQFVGEPAPAWITGTAHRWTRTSVLRTSNALFLRLDRVVDG